MVLRLTRLPIEYGSCLMLLLDTFKCSKFFMSPMAGGSTRNLLCAMLMVVIDIMVKREAGRASRALDDTSMV